jgi:hypothetical protein
MRKERQRSDALPGGGVTHQTVVLFEQILVPQCPTKQAGSRYLRHKMDGFAENRPNMIIVAMTLFKRVRLSELFYLPFKHVQTGDFVSFVTNSV